MVTQIIDNFLTDDDFHSISEIFLSPSSSFGWYFCDSIADPLDTSDVYFIHTFYHQHTINSSFWPKLNPIIEKLNARAFLRVKANLYLRSSKQIQHNFHTDFDFPHKGAIFSINDNNGYTELKDGTKIESKANRCLFFNPGEKHSSTNCTDAPYRMNIVFNYL